MDVISAARCVPIRELSRSTGRLVAEIERDGRALAISRLGRMVALLMPLPERLIVEFEEGVSPEVLDDGEEAVGDVELSPLAKEFLVDAASTPTGYWYPPESAYNGDMRATFKALEELVVTKLAEEVSNTKIRVLSRGRRVAKALRDRGDMTSGVSFGSP
jgi:antitoxin (DNA-binding transcriptional repressor) of toxin-antitoxin stability system